MFHVMRALLSRSSYGPSLIEFPGWADADSPNSKGIFQALLSSDHSAATKLPLQVLGACIALLLCTVRYEDTH